MNKVYTHCIDDGHGGTDPGAVGKRSTHEADINLAIGKIVGRIMTEQGQKVIFTRTTDKFLTLATRADIANKAGCRTFTSIHCNSAAAIDAHGIETWSFTNSVEGLKLSKVVQGELVKTTGLTDRGSKQANFGVLRMSNMVAILVESAFISNTNEEVLLMQAEYQEKVALGIVKGIFKYLGLTFNQSIIKTTPIIIKVAATKIDQNILQIQQICIKLGVNDHFGNRVVADGIDGPNTQSAKAKLKLFLTNILK